MMSCARPSGMPTGKANAVTDERRKGQPGKSETSLIEERAHLP
jgi:hypothetical protein